MACAVREMDERVRGTDAGAAGLCGGQSRLPEAMNEPHEYEVGANGEGSQTLGIRPPPDG
jgi:hypothetical protein